MKPLSVQGFGLGQPPEVLEFLFSNLIGFIGGGVLGGDLNALFPKGPWCWRELSLFFDWAMLSFLSSEILRVGFGSSFGSAVGALMPFFDGTVSLIEIRMSGLGLMSFIGNGESSCHFLKILTFFCVVEPERGLGTCPNPGV